MLEEEVARIAGTILSGLMASDSTLSEKDAIEKAIRMARATLTASALTPVLPPPVENQSVLSPDDFTYLDIATLPLDVEGQTRFGYSAGAFSGRVVTVNGVKEIHFFITGATAATGWNDPVYEVKYNGPGQRCTLVHNWGNIAPTRISKAGNHKPIRGLLWDEKTQQLLWTYMDSYNVTGAHDPCLGASRLNPDGSVIVSGPWRMTDHSMRVGGYLVKLPDGRFASGAPIGSGNATSPWGVYLSAFTLPPEGTPADGNDGHVTIQTTNLIYSDIDHPQPRTPDADECGWTHYGERDSEGAEPQHNPTQDGTGCTVNGELCGCSFGPRSAFFAIDTISAAAWIESASKHGLICIGQLVRTIAEYASEYGQSGRCHAWYGPAQIFGEQKLCAHGQNDTRYASGSTGPGCTTMQGSMFIYDPADLGTKPPLLLPPVVDGIALSSIAASGASFPAVAGNGYNDVGFTVYGGAFWEPDSQQFFLTATSSEWQSEWRPVIHPFKIGG